MTKLTESDDLPSALLEEIQLYNVALKQEDGEQLSEDDISALYQVLKPLSPAFFIFLSQGRRPTSPHLLANESADEERSTEEVSPVQDYEDEHHRARP